MAEFIDGPSKSYIANGAISIHQRVKLESAGTVAVAGLTDRDIGTAFETVADGKPITIILSSKQGTVKMIAIEAMNIGVVVYTETDGKVQDTAQSTAYLVGTNMGPAPTTDGDIIEVMRIGHGIVVP